MKLVTVDLTIPEQVIEITEDSQLVGLFVGKDASELKTNVKIVHSKPDLKSNALFKAVLYDQAKFDFTGDLVINKGAKNTDTYLKIDVLMLSPQAKATAVPSLEIMEDAVKGGHGATVGEVDAEQLFYLMARGLDRKQAEDVIVEAFIGDLQK